MAIFYSSLGVLTVRSVRISWATLSVKMERMTASAATSERVSSILAAACRVAVREGAHGLRMASVAAEAGVSKALVHYYFTTRRELLRNAVAWSEEQWRAALEAEVASLPTGRERAERMLSASIDAEQPALSDQRALWNEVWSSLRLDDEIRPLVEQSYRTWLERLTAVIQEGLDDGSIPAHVDAQAAAWRLAAVGDGLDSMLYLGLLSREQAVELIRVSVRNELA
jgi:AcrR family transcriptional regulator